MVRHIVVWNFKEGISAEERKQHGEVIKRELEGLKAVIPGVHSLEVIIDPLPTGNADLALNSVFESEQALADYQVHPEHVRVSSFIKSLVCNRMCIDYLE